MKTAHTGMKRIGQLLVIMLVMFGMVFGAAAEGGAASAGTNDLDGSKIEGVKVVWVTQDHTTTAEGTATPQAELEDKNHLYLSSVSNGEMRMVYKIEAEFSGQYDYAPGDITITIPARVWRGRRHVADENRPGETVGVVDESKLLGELELPLPAAPSKKADFNWQIVGDNYVLTNTRTIGATSSVSIEVAICGVRPIDVVDMSETAPITAHVEVVTKQGNTIELTSTPITAQLDTQARITSAHKNGELFETVPADLNEELLKNLPEGTAPEDYLYVRWYTYHSHNNNQPYSLDIEDVLGDAYEKVTNEQGKEEMLFVTEGIFLGSSNCEGEIIRGGDIDFRAEIGDHFGDHTTGTQYANTAYLWSAYRKDAFGEAGINEPLHVYYLENEVEWTLTETDAAVEDAGRDKGKDVQKVTRAKDRASVRFAPVVWEWQMPVGSFGVEKWTESVGREDWLYGYALNLLESRDEVDMQFIVKTVGYGYPWTSELTKGYTYEQLKEALESGEVDVLGLEEAAFGKLGWKQVTDDYDTFFNFEKEPLTAEDFEFKSLRVSVPRKQKYVQGSNGPWAYVTDSKLPTPDLKIEYQLNNEDTWYPAATATWGEDGLGQFAFVDVNTAAGVTTSGMTVYFPENVTDTRHTFVSNVFGGKMAEHCDIAMLDWTVYPTITMKSSDRVYAIVQELFEENSNPFTKFRNDVVMDVYGWVGEDGEGTLVLDNDFDTSLATYEGASYGVALNKSGRSRNDVENQRLLISYTATLTEQSNLKERSEYDEAVEVGVIPAETSGIWYDLLPPHVTPLLDTVKLRSGDNITNMYTVEDYKGTGRTLLVVEAELTPVLVDGSIGYADRPALSFDAAYTWADMDEYGRELVNYVAFESTVDELRMDTLGTLKNQRGEPDTPAGGNNATTPSMPKDIVEALTDLDPNTDENRFVYGKTSNTVSALTYAVSGLEKAVKNDLVGIWTQGLDEQEQVTVYEGHNYTYRLRVSSAETTSTKGIVIYDTIENYIIPDPASDKDTDATKAADFAHTQERKDWTGDWQGKGQWRGTLEKVDLTEFVNAGVKPVLLYSTIPNLQFADSSSESTDDNFDEDTELFSSGSYDITDREIWQVAELDEKGVWQVPAGLNVTAVAIDATTTADGKEFILRPEEALAGYLKMRAPDDEGDEDTWNAKGAYARKADAPAEIDWEAAMDEKNNMYAYNNARVRLIQGQAMTNGETNWLSNYRMIRNDYTRVGIVPEIVTVEKVWQDQNDHDGMRPESVTVSVLRRLAGLAGKAQPVLDKDGQPITAVLDESNGWKAELKQMDIVNEDGIRYLYSFEEMPVEGYTSKVQFIDVNHYTMTNIHPNEQVEISGEKIWDDDDNALGLRPEQVTLKLYRDGEYIDTRIVKPNSEGDWKYTFGKLDKYAQGGKECEYTVEEEYVPKYKSEADGYVQVKNTYIPVGDLEVSKTLKNATDEAKKKEFTFTLVLLAEQTDPDAPAVPLMEKYPYTIYTLQDEEWVAGETGEIGNSGTFKLKENQKILVEGLPSESTYEVIENEAAGFTSTSTDAAGAIRAGQTAQAAFVNEYKASGTAQLSVTKKLTGHAIRKNQFRFELVDENGNVIRTARVEAPETGATTGGSGVEIESVTQAIFGQLEYTQADDGKTYHYTVREVDTGKLGYTTDMQVYEVAVNIEDHGDGTMTVTPIYTKNGEAVTELKFENSYEAHGELTLKAWKTLEGRELQDGEFSFELYSYDENNNGLGELLGTATNDAEGNVVFDALTFDQNSVSLDENNPATYTYLIREKQGTDKTVAYSNQEYVITVSVFDNGDGTLSFAQGTQQAERNVVSCSRCFGNRYEYVCFIEYSEVFPNGYYYRRCAPERSQVNCYYTKYPFCDLCGGMTVVSNQSCPRCYGTGLEANQNYDVNKTLGDYFLHGKRYIVSATSKQGSVFGIATKPDEFIVCKDCEGVGTEPGAMTITGDVTIPVFANELKPGSLAVTKQVQGAGSSNPDQEFTFHVKLNGEVPEGFDYKVTGPAVTPEPEATPKPVVTPRPPAPVNTANQKHYTAEELQGQAYGVLNLDEDHEDYGKLTFFRSDSSNPVDPYGNAIDLAAGDGKRHKDEEKNVVHYLLDESINSNEYRPWYTDRSSVLSVVVKDPIKPRGGYRFFYSLSKAITMNLNNMDTSDMTSMYGMFNGCNSIVELDLSSFDTSNVKDMSSMLSSCSKLKKADLSSFNTSNVTDMSSMFSHSYYLTPDMRTFDTSNVTKMTFMFYFCQYTPTLDVSNFDTRNVTSMSYMFASCQYVQSLNVSGFDTRKTEWMQHTFDNCYRLIELDLSGFETDSNPSLSSMFENSEIRYLDISSLGDISGTDIDTVEYLRTIKIGDKTKVSSVSYAPKASTYAPYDGKWMNVDDPSQVLTAKELFTTGGNAGTWTWNVGGYQLNFEPGEGAGSMRPVKNQVGKGHTFTPTFYRYGYDLIGFSDDDTSTVKYPYENGKVIIPDNNGYVKDQVVILTAQWEKCDTNVTVTDGGFSFTLKKNETATFNGLPATTAYEVWEDTPAGWVLVSKVDDSGVIQPLETSEAVFTNAYEPTKAQASLRASKLLDGKAPAKTFEFTLSEAGEILQTKENAAGGVSFDLIEYTEAGEHTYTIAEKAGNDQTVNYDDETYTAVVNVTDDGQGNLSAKVTYKNADGEELTAPPVFENTTKPGGLKISKEIEGTLTDKARAQEFTFEISLTDALLQPWSGELTMGEESLTVTNGKATVTLKGGESVTLTEIPAGLKYSVQEIGSYPGWTMDGSVQEGKIAPTVTAETSFTNAYSLTGQASVEAKKALLGREMEADEFSFQLIGADNTVAAEATNGSDGSVLFPQLTYTEEGEWKYRIVEIIPGDDEIDNTVEYSTEEIGVTVTAKDENGDGKLTTTVTYSPEEKTITNELKPGALQISKMLNSSNPAHGEKEFTFTLTLTDAEGKALNGSYVLNDTGSFEVQDGEATINLRGGENAVISGLPAGTAYTVAEAEEPGFTTVSEGESGVIAPDETANVSFINTYAAQGVYDFSVTKTLAGRELTAEAFWFRLQDENGSVLETASNAADGKVSFSRLTFTQKDAGNRTYRISETNTYAPGMTYDSRVQEITLTITDNGDGTMTVTDSLNGEAVEFKNVYSDMTSVSVEKVWQDEGNKLNVRPESVTVELYRNGEKQTETVLNAENEWKHTFTDLAAFDEKGVSYTYTVKEKPVVGYDSMQSRKDGVRVITNTVQGVLDVSKTVVGGTDESKEFTFTVTLTKADAPLTAELMLEKGEASEAVTPDADGKVSFTLKHGETARLIGLPIGTVYTVEETGEAGYTATAENAEGLIQRYEEHKAIFTNTYEAVGETTFSGSKTLEGRELAEGEFSFILLDENGDEIETVKNDADGKFSFTTLEYLHNKDYSDLGEHTYTVKEVKGALKGVTYDTTEYKITVTVTDNGDGTLKVVASDNAAALNFINYYDADGELTLRAAKTVNGAEPREDEVFSFELRDAAGKVLQTVKNEKGKITFEALKYTEADVGKSFLYTVREQQEEKPGYTTDATVYTVAVWVADAGDGSLKVTKAISSEGKSVEAMTFANTYEAEGEWKPIAAKTVNGAEPREDQVYEFTLTDEDGNTILAENEKGEITFDTLIYDLADAGKTYTYTVKEITTPTDLLATDDSTYTVDVTVTDNKDGTLDVKPVITKDGETAEEITFENKLTTLLSISKTVEGIETEETFPMTVKLYNANGTEAEGEYAYTGDAEGKLKSGDVIELAHGQSVTISGLLPGMTYTVTEAAAAAYETTVNGNAGNSMEGTLAETENEVAFVNKYKTTMFMVKKSWQGGGGGAIELTLYANGEKIEPQPVYSRDENVYVYTDLPMYDEQDQIIVYSAKERYVDGFLTIYKNVAPYADETKAIYDGGTIINKAIVKADFSVKKEWSGLAEGETAPAIQLVLYCNGVATDIKTPKPDRNGWYKYYDLPGEIDGKPAVYTVKELPVEGYETSYTLADGTSAEYADNGGTITNAKIPQTGDNTPLALWLTLMGASAMMLVLLLKRRKA